MTATPVYKKVNKPLWKKASSVCGASSVYREGLIPFSTGRVSPNKKPFRLIQTTGKVPVSTRTTSEAGLMDNWLFIQSINLQRHAQSIRPFSKTEFGTGPASPSEFHIDAVNRFLDKFKAPLVEQSRWVDAAALIARKEPSAQRLKMLLERKHAVSNQVLYVEGIWDFYFDLFVQRLSHFGERLRAVDRIAANCYEDLYLGMGNAQPTPTLLPFSYAQSGFSPLTYRRGVPLSKLKRHPNLFPLIMLPQHRLDNVWALSSVLHEVSHNLQADLGLWEEIPKQIYYRLQTEGRFSHRIAMIWARWHKETMADMFALVLGGPAAVESLMDVVGRKRSSVVRFNPHSIHPTPYLRVLINLILMRRMGFHTLADNLQKVWLRLYPTITNQDIPSWMTQSFYPAAEMVIDTMVFKPYPQFGNKSLIQSIQFGPVQMSMIEHAARLLSQGKDPGTIPVRFMVGAARFALDQRLASPQYITDNFYRILGRR